MLILVSIVAISFAGLILRQKDAIIPAVRSQFTPESTMLRLVSYDLLSFSISTNHLSIAPSTCELQETFAATTQSVLTNSTRAEIYSFVQANPGVSFRGICDGLGLSIGLAQFHLGVLTKAGLVSFFRDGKYKRFFGAKLFSKKQMKIIAVLRHKTEGNILKTILEKTQVSHSELARELSITSQGLTWHINRLEKTHLISEAENGNRLLYSLDQTNASLLAEMAKVIGQI